jgi:plastocyanin
MPRLLGALAALGALTIVGAGVGAASASTPQKVHATVIKMKQDGKNLFFEGPETVAAGATLKIKNVTDPQKIGPHTFSLVRENTIPTDAADIKDCEKKFALICGAVIKWHDVDVQTGEIGINPVEVGHDGWDTEGSLKRKGDSWVAEKEGQTFKQKVSAPAGTTLSYFCAVHPFMVGQITVGD